MAAPDYTVLARDLAASRDRQAIIDPGTKYNAVMVQAVPGASGATLHFGTNKEPVPVTQGDSWNVTTVDGQGCAKAADEGLFLSNPVGAGNIVLVVSLGEVGLQRLA